jgi:hypothetical protein
MCAMLPYEWRVRQYLDLRNVRGHVHHDYKSGAISLALPRTRLFWESGSDILTL